MEKSLLRFRPFNAIARINGPSVIFTNQHRFKREAARRRLLDSSGQTFSSDFNLSRHVRTHPRSVARLHPLSLPSSNFFVVTHLINSRAVCCKVLERYRQHPISNFTNGNSPIGYFSAVFAPEGIAPANVEIGGAALLALS